MSERPHSSRLGSRVCPSCRHEQPARLERAVVYVCEGCRSLIHIHEGRVSAEHALSEASTAHQALGARDQDPRYELVGAMTLENSSAERWVELLFVSDAGEERWLAIDEGERYLFRELSEFEMSRSRLPLYPDEVATAPALSYEGRRYTCDEQGSARITGLRGEFPLDYELGERYFYWQGYDEDDEDSLSAEWSAEGSVQWSHGVWRSGGVSGGGYPGQIDPDRAKSGCVKFLVLFFLLQFLPIGFLFGGGSHETVGVFEIPVKTVQQEGGRLELETPSFRLDGPGSARVELVFPEELKRIAANIYLKPLDAPAEEERLLYRSTDEPITRDDFARLTEEGKAFGLLDPNQSCSIEFGIQSAGRYLLRLEGVTEESVSTERFALSTDPIAIFVDSGFYSSMPVGAYWGLVILFAAVMIFSSGLRGRLSLTNEDGNASFKHIAVLLAVVFVGHLLVKQVSLYQSAQTPLTTNVQSVERSPHLSHFIVGAGVYTSTRWIGHRVSHSLRNRSSRSGRSHSGFGGGK